jgi:hypothetical protein
MGADDRLHFGPAEGGVSFRGILAQADQAAASSRGFRGERKAPHTAPPDGYLRNRQSGGGQYSSSFHSASIAEFKNFPSQEAMARASLGWLLCTSQARPVEAVDCCVRVLGPGSRVTMSGPTGRSRSVTGRTRHVIQPMYDHVSSRRRGPARRRRSRVARPCWQRALRKL